MGKKLIVFLRFIYNDVVSSNIISSIDLLEAAGSGPKKKKKKKGKRKKKRNEFIRSRRARAVAKGQYESSGAFIGPRLLSRGPLLRKSNEGRREEKRKRERGGERKREESERERDRKRKLREFRKLHGARSNIYPVIFVRVLRVACGIYICVCMYMYTRDRTISTNGAHESLERASE